jgi:glycine cleavage system H protein
MASWRSKKEQLKGQAQRTRPTNEANERSQPNGGERVEYPEDLRYSREHEWARSENGRIRVGITDFAQDALGDVVYVDLPEPGTQVTAGQAFGEVESTKSVSDVFAPVSGTIVERNAALEEKPELVNEQPYGDGWLIAIEASDQSELDQLLDSGGYQEHVSSA